MSKTKILITGVAFFLVGICLLAGGFLSIKNAFSFLNNSEKVDGVVTNLLQSRNPDNNGYLYTPEISFTDVKGKEIIFTSNISSTIASNQVGDKVSVIYDKKNSQNTKIDSFFQIWIAPIVFVVLGIIFFLIGLFTLIYQKRKIALKNYLLSGGTRISAKVTSVQTKGVRSAIDNTMDSNYYNDNTLNFGNNPNPTYQVIAQWLSPADNQIYVFKSDDLNYDPTSYVSGKEITVYIDPTNPQKYYVDVSTLPKVAN